MKPVYMQKMHVAGYGLNSKIGSLKNPDLEKLVDKNNGNKA